ncbi:MAG TPA: glycosyltransferase family 2 protein, partial [Vicinamibacteria bacterium]|nr:glycosyltransferase family 2 protein [Vicinamibacteria bacterium]
MHDRDVLFVIPALNEEANLPSVIQELRAAWPEAPLLVVSDASSDGTARVARELGAQAVSLPFHLGYGGAVQTGIKYGLRRRLRVVVTFDADGQHDPADVGPLVQAVRDGADVAIGSRALAAGSYRGGVARRGGRALFGLLARWLTGLQL